MRKYFENAQNILLAVFTDSSYSDRALSDAEKVDAMTTKLVYGVLEKNVTLEYILDSLVDKKPRPEVYVLLKIGAYALLYLDNVPAFATVSECVEVQKARKKELAGFVNAVLKKVAARSFKLPSENSKNYLSVTYSVPQWFVNKLLKQYPREEVIKLLQEPACTYENARVNTRVTTAEDVEKRLKAGKADYLKGELSGTFLVHSNDKTATDLFNTGLITYQAPSSMLAVTLAAPQDGDRIIDLCAAPGGKSVLLSELCPESTVVACDLHPHRVELIKKYAKRMHAENIIPSVADAAVFNEKYADSFDYVLVDAPCSCFGTFRKHPDVFLQRGESDVKKLAETQKKIVTNAVKYLKKGGVLVYSTCTLFEEENGGVVRYACENLGLKTEKMTWEYENDGTLQLLPNGTFDGFYIAKMRKL